MSILIIIKSTNIKNKAGTFLVFPGIGNPLASARDMGLIPGLGRDPHAMERLSPRCNY